MATRRKTAAEQMRDAQIDHMVDLRAYSRNVVRRMISVLNRADAAMFTELIDKLSRMDPESFTIERLESMLVSVQGLNAQAFQRVQSELQSELEDFTSMEVSHQGNMMVDALPAKFAIARVDPQQVYAAAMSRPFQGNLLKGFLSEMEESRARLIRRTIADGYTQARTTDQVIRTLRGTRAAGYADGLLEQPRHEIAAVARTALSHTAGFARDRVWEANADLMKGLQWLSTLDLRTTPECQVRDGLTYTMDHKPIDHPYPWRAGPGRLHFSCRSTSVPVFKSFRELAGLPALEGEEILGSVERESMDGQVAAKTTYQDWLSEQSAERQDEVLGPARGALFREGGLSLRELYDAEGAEMTLEDLRRKAGAAVFRKAGLL